MLQVEIVSAVPVPGTVPYEKYIHDTVQYRKEKKIYSEYRTYFLLP